MTRLVMLRKSRQGAHFREMAGLYNQLIVYGGSVSLEMRSQSTRAFVPRWPQLGNSSASGHHSFSLTQATRALFLDNRS